MLLTCVLMVDEGNQSHLVVTVGFFLVLRVSQSAGQPGRRELGLLHSGQNIPSPLTHASVPLQREAEVESVN